MPSPLSRASTAAALTDAQRGHAPAQSHVGQQANRPQGDLRRNEQELARTYASDREPASVAYPVPDKWHTAEEVDVRAEPLTPVNLVYPEQSATRIRGRVRIALFIDERGWVRKAQVLASEPKRFFDDAAIRAWQDVRFSPALKGDVPVKSEKVLEMDFTPY
jgi:TonB family protein